MECHPALSPSLCGLSDIHTIKTPEIPILLYILDTTLPGLIEQLRAQSDRKPVKLVVVDTLTELFHSHSKVSADTLRERSKNLAEISTLLHQLANKYRIAVLVLNEVMDVVCKGYAPDTVPSKDILYREQARWFNRADSIAGEDRKEASLGLVWANQINARIMLSRTERTRFLEVEQRKPKRRRLDPTRTQHCSETQPTRIRRLSIIFSSVSPPASLDYIVSEGGIFVLPDTTEPNPTPPSSSTPLQPPSSSTPLQPPSSSTPLQPPSSSPSHDIDGVSPLDVGVIADEWDAYWQEAESDADLYRNVHID
ncbi:hypothetical protein WOLCODRAFT_65896 [Wolfiporia cocos MD-104 SS10]|uniref:RecA family profile 1 domain-containing protein n=1 Tax=Wolfiporia cocos (strain MD-104) TaxID=742152 RepID=A0A2H3JNY0_WOLCO|nr:hypothetical protein WOLCODRAFT_65896 [Wolfiporia cocos MD-104 SS10]